MVLEYLRVAYDWWSQHKTPFELFALVLTVMGTYFAIKSIRDGAAMTRDLRLVFDHLTTKTLGPYPDYMPELERLIAGARESVVIACDFPGYGVWSDRGKYNLFVKTLENRKAERVRMGRSFEVHLVVLDKKNRAQALEERFPEATWREYVRRGGFGRSRRLYEELENTQVSEKRETFIQEMADRQQRAMDGDLRFADRWETSHLMPMHLFIADGERAIFAIPGYGEELAEYGFYTEESGLVRALRSVWEHYLSEAKKVGEEPKVARLRG